MSKKEAPRRLGEQATGQKLSDLSIWDCNTGKKNLQAIFDLLPRGEENAVSSKALADLVGVKTVRELQHRVSAERESGALILSTCRGGYFRPAAGEQGQREIAAFARTLQARAINTLRAIRAAREALENVEGQLDLDDLEV